MFNKNDEDFFKENTESDQASRKLMEMISDFKPSTTSDFSTGSKVEGPVSRIGTEFIHIDVGNKLEAIMNIKECRDDSGNLTVSIGDILSGYIISDKENELVISKKLSSNSAAKEELYHAQKNKIPVQGKITGVSKDGLSVKVFGKRAFCPISQIEIRFVDNVNVFLGKTLDFVITRVSEGGKNIVLSRIPLLEQELLSRIEELEKVIDEHPVLRGTITKVTDFGIFVDIGGIEGLVHISELSWEHVDKIDDRYIVGQEVQVIVLQIARKTPLKNSKVSLSIKQVTDNPWNSIEKTFTVGQSVSGKVVRLTNFGAFVELKPGVDGLIHISEMSWIKKVHHPSEIVSEGSQVSATILAIDLVKKTIALSLKDLSSDPWRDIESRFPQGSEVDGIIAKKSRYGYFIDLSEGITGLLVFSKIAPEKKELLKEQDTIKVTIDSIDTENRRISLSYGIVESRSDQEEILSYTNTKQQSESSSTEFGAALKAALNRNK